MFTVDADMCIKNESADDDRGIDRVSGYSCVCLLSLQDSFSLANNETSLLFKLVSLNKMF
jgi:hypothetical protein